jgi:uncharacterized membrane protein
MIAFLSIMFDVGAFYTDASFSRFNVGMLSSSGSRAFSVITVAVHPCISQNL